MATTPQPEGKPADGSTSAQPDGGAPVAGAPPSQPSGADEVIEELPIELASVGAPAYSIEGAERRAWWQEVTRIILASGFTLAFVGTVVFGCWMATTSHWAQAKELLQILLPAQMALIGSATGFYFASKKD